MRYANRQHAVLTKALYIELRRPPSHSSFCYFFRQSRMGAHWAAIRDWTIAQIPCGAADLEQLVYNGKTLKGSIEPTSGGGSGFIAQVTLCLAALREVISQACYTSIGNGERAVLRQLLGELDLEGVLIKSDTLDTKRPLSGRSRSKGQTFS